jgi:1-deoxy-D-xylulose-5-phosphate reductoisomerase
VLNAANEVAVKLFLEEKIAFAYIPDIIEKALSKVQYVAKPAYSDFVNSDAEARKSAMDFYPTFAL